MAGEGATRGPLVRSHMFVEEDGLTSVESAAPVFPTGHKMISMKGRAGLVLGCAAVAACLAALALWVGGAKPCVRSLLGGDVYISGETADPEEKLSAALALAARRLAAPGPSIAPANETAAAPPATSGPAATGIEAAEPPAAPGPNATANESAVAAWLSPPGPNATADEAAVPEGAALAAATAAAAVEAPNSTFAAALRAAAGNLSKALNLASPPGQRRSPSLQPVSSQGGLRHPPDWTEDPYGPPASRVRPTRSPSWPQAAEAFGGGAAAAAAAAAAEAGAPWQADGQDSQVDSTLSPTARRPFTVTRDRILSYLDADRDGFVTVEELKEALLVFKAVMEQLGGDLDGEVTLQEMRMWLTQVNPRTTSMGPSWTTRYVSPGDW